MHLAWCVAKLLYRHRRGTQGRIQSNIRNIIGQCSTSHLLTIFKRVISICWILTTTYFRRISESIPDRCGKGLVTCSLFIAGGAGAASSSRSIVGWTRWNSFVRDRFRRWLFNGVRWRSRVITNRREIQGRLRSLRLLCWRSLEATCTISRCLQNAWFLEDRRILIACQDNTLIRTLGKHRIASPSPLGICPKGIVRTFARWLCLVGGQVLGGR